MRLKRVVRGISAFSAALPLSAKIILPCIVLIMAFAVVGLYDDAAQEEDTQARIARLGILFDQAQARRAEMERTQFNRLTPTEHLAAAQKAWDPVRGGDVELALRHLHAIAPEAPETKVAAVLLPAAERARQRAEQARQEAEQARREEEQAQREAEEQAQQQRRRDADAEMYSYWSTVLRVDTDMDSFWLPNEERVCQTYPDGKGRVALVACNQTGSHRDHNIPVTFWGGVERNTVSNWKCRREKDFLSDHFVCRAID